MFLFLGRPNDNINLKWFTCWPWLARKLIIPINILILEANTLKSIAIETRRTLTILPIHASCIPITSAAHRLSWLRFSAPGARATIPDLRWLTQTFIVAEQILAFGYGRTVCGAFFALVHVIALLSIALEARLTLAVVALLSLCVKYTLGVNTALVSLTRVSSLVCKNYK